MVSEGRAGRRVLRASETFTATAAGVQNQTASEPTVDGAVLKIPFKLTLNKITMRNVGLECKGRCSFLSKHFKDVFEKKEEWGLAALLLHEHAKGNESRWYPFVRTLRMHMLRKSVLQELDGTFAAELYVHCTVFRRVFFVAFVTIFSVLIADIVCGTPRQRPCFIG